MQTICGTHKWTRLSTDSHGCLHARAHAHDGSDTYRQVTCAIENPLKGPPNSTGVGVV